MANPKRRHSKQRGRLRRTFYKISLANFSTCPQCGKQKLSHRLCPFCGYYKGKEVIRVLSKEEKKKERQKKRG